MRRFVDAIKAWISRMFKQRQSHDAKSEFDDFFGS
jgi:hypothetical protein